MQDSLNAMFFSKKIFLEIKQEGARDRKTLLCQSCSRIFKIQWKVGIVQSLLRSDLDKCFTHIGVTLVISSYCWNILSFRERWKMRRINNLVKLFLITLKSILPYPALLFLWTDESTILRSAVVRSTVCFLVWYVSVIGIYSSCKKTDIFLAYAINLFY